MAPLARGLRLARLRRRLPATALAQRIGISRTTLYKAETGEPGVTLGTYLRILAGMGLEGDFNALAADDKVGRKLQDLGLEPPRRRSPRKKPAAP